MVPAPKSKPKGDPYRELLEILRRQILNGRFAELAIGTDIPFINGVVLDEFDRCPGFSFQQVSARLKVHCSTIVRILRTLEGQRLVTLRTDRRDLRRRQVSLTAKGRRILALIRDNYADVHTRQAAALTAVERGRLLDLLNRFADGEQAPELKPLPRESGFFIALRRLGLAHGLSSRDFLGSGLAATEWLILTELRQQRLGVGSLIRLLRIPQSTLSLRLKRMTGKGLLSVNTSKKDGRVRQLSVSARGCRSLDQLAFNAERRFQQSLAGLSKSEVAELVSLFARYTGAGCWPSAPL